MSAGQGSVAFGVSGESSTARCEEPESNHTSRISLSLRQLDAPQEQRVPAGSNSSTVCVNQASAPSLPNHSRTSACSVAQPPNCFPHLVQNNITSGPPQSTYGAPHQSDR